MLQEQDPAPDFTLTAHDGSAVRLSDFRGKQVIVYFYPRNETPGCTKEACSLRDSFPRISTSDTVILGISPDTPESHRKFREHHQLPFTLLSDPEHQVMAAWGAWGEKKLYGKAVTGVIRTTFILDAQHVIRKIIRKVDTADHGNQVIPWL